VRLCIIITLVKQAELYDDICQNSLPSAPEMVQYRSRCRECLSEVVVITAELSPDDYYYLDPYLGVGVSISYYICGPINHGLGDKVCWNRAISLLTEGLPNGSKPSLAPPMALIPPMPRVSSFTEARDAQINVLRMARRSVGMSVCLVPSGPKPLCSQLMEYRRANGLNNLGRFAEV
jgi:hypothetical protein